MKVFTYTPAEYAEEGLRDDALDRAALAKALSACNACEIPSPFCFTNLMGYCETCFFEAVGTVKPSLEAKP